MTRAAIIHKPSAPSYGDFYARQSARHGPVIRGAYLDIDVENIEALRDPFGNARRFAHALAKATGQPFAWGWYDGDLCGARPGVCPAEFATEHLRVNGRTDRG